MNKNKKKYYLSLSTLVIMATSTSFTINASAEGNANKGNKIHHGMQGFYFYDKEQTDLAFLNENAPSELKPNLEDRKKYLNPQKKVQSAYWSGTLELKEDGGKLDLSDNEHTTLYVSEQGVTDQIKETSRPTIEKGKKYNVSIVWKGDTIPSSIELSLTNEKGQQRKLTEKDWIIPKNETEAKQKVEQNSLRGTVEPYAIVDYDGDGIPDSLEISGYTVDVVSWDYAIVPWDPALYDENKGYTKYVSSPRKWSTAGDPYSDYQKVTGTLDASVSDIARNPLVAAYPIITTEIENIILSKNITGIISNGGSSDQTISMSTSNSITNEIHSDVSATVHGSLLDFGASITGSFGKSHSSTATIDNTNSSSQGENWSQSLQLNEADAGYIGASVRYKNIGTAPIYHVKPTISMVLPSNQPIVTVTAKENQISNQMSPGTQYPAKGQAGILFNKSDDFNSTPVVINKTQVDLLEKTNKLRMDTLQVDGTMVRLDDTGQPIIQDSNWSTYFPQIENTTAKIMLEMDGSEYERRISAVDMSSPLEKTKPEVTLEEALNLLYGIKRNKGYEFNMNVVNMKQPFKFIMDKNTEEEFAKQLDSMGKYPDIYQVKLRAKMNILVQKGSSTMPEFSGWDMDNYDGHIYRVFFKERVEKPIKFEIRTNSQSFGIKDASEVVPDYGGKGSNYLDVKRFLGGGIDPRKDGLSIYAVDAKDDNVRRLIKKY